MDSNNHFGVLEDVDAIKTQTWVQPKCDLCKKKRHKRTDRCEWEVIHLFPKPLPLSLLARLQRVFWTSS